MRDRREAPDVSDRLLEAASKIFAEKGYRATTVAEICRAAGANVAAVNYYFGSKQALYGYVWRRALEQCMREYPLDGGLGLDAPPERRLGAFVRSHLHRVLGPGSQSVAGQILLMEMANPTPAIEDVMLEALGPLVEQTHALMSELLGPKASTRQIHFCAMSVVHQCLAFSHRRCRRKLPFLEEIGDLDAFIEDLAAHITEFSLAGIAAVRRRIQAEQAEEPMGRARDS